MLVAMQYLQAFGARDLARIERILTDDVTLQDPFVGLVKGKGKVLEIYRGFFEAHSRVNLDLKRQYQLSHDSVAVEFTLRFSGSDGKETVIEGVDCIEISNGKIAAIRAYLDTKV